MSAALNQLIRILHSALHTPHSALLLLLLPSLALAQPALPLPLLSADQAVEIALANNYDVQIVRADADIAHLNNTKGNAGMLPTVNLVANETFTFSAFQQKLANGTEFNNPGALFNNANAAVQLNWTLYDGRRMHIAKKRLETLDALGQLNLQSAIQQTTAAVLQTYYDIASGQLQINAIEEIIALNTERLRIAEARLAAGFAAQTDALQARIDLNQRRSDLLTQQNAVLNAKRALNLLLVRPADTAFEVLPNIENTFTPDRAALLNGIQTRNPSLQALQKSTEVAALQIEESAALRKPRIVGTSQLLALRTDNGAGFALNNTQAGLSAGAGLVLPLYSGGNITRQIETAKVAAKQAALRNDAQRLTLENTLDQLIAAYQTQKEILALEEMNVVSARENLNVSTERFRLGQTTSLETQTAQNTLSQSLTRRNLALYSLKLGEIQLKLLAGGL